MCILRLTFNPQIEIWRKNPYSKMRKKTSFGNRAAGDDEMKFTKKNRNYWGQ